MSSTQQHRTYNVTATFPDMDRARQGVEALEEHGVDATSIFLGGRAARDAAVERDTAERDEAMLQHTGRGARRGLVVGILVGALIGLAIGLLFWDGRAWVLGTAVLGFALACGGLGAYIGLLSRGKVSGPYEETFADVEGPVVVGVHTEDEQAFETASETLAGAGPEELKRFDGQGNALPEPV
jgi:hypothetical protein